MSVALRGNLEDFGISDVFQLIGQQGKTGVLEILGPARRRMRLVFDGGKIVRAAPEGAHDGDALGEMLVRCGRLTPEQRDTAERRAAGDSLSLSRALFAEGFLSVPEIEEIEEILTRDTLFELLPWKSGSFHFEAEPVSHEREPGTLLPAEQVLMDGLRMVDEARALRALVPADEVVFRRSGTVATARERLAPEGPRALEALDRVWQLVDGRLPARRVMDLSRLGSFEAMRLLAHLVRCQAIAALSGDEVERMRRRPVRATAAAGPRASLVRLVPATAALLVAIAAAIALGVRAPEAPLLDPLPAAQDAFAVRRIRNAAEAWRAAHGTWPRDLESLVRAGWLPPDALTLANAPLYHAAQPEDDALVLAPDR